MTAITPSKSFGYNPHSSNTSLQPPVMGQHMHFSGPGVPEKYKLCSVLLKTAAAFTRSLYPGVNFSRPLVTLVLTQLPSAEFRWNWLLEIQTSRVEWQGHRHVVASTLAFHSTCSVEHSPAQS